MACKCGDGLRKGGHTDLNKPSRLSKATDDELKGKEHMKAMRDEYCARIGCNPEDLQNYNDPNYEKFRNLNVEDMSEEYRRFYIGGMANATPETETDRLRHEMHILDCHVDILRNKLYWNRMFISFAYICISILTFIVAFK